MHIVEFNSKSNSNEKSLGYNVKVGRVARGNYTYNVTIATEGYSHEQVIEKLDDMIASTILVIDEPPSVVNVI